jgi:formamidopyrimidine-DNA glycosylase
VPEGHTIHRIARQHHDVFAGRPVRVTSPQGRFADGAALLDGRVLEEVEALGKHLFYRFGHRILHVHLGLVGTFQLFHEPAPPPSAGTRLAMRANGAAAYLSGPMVCGLIDPGTEDEIRADLGPDPLAGGTREEFAAALGRKSMPAGAALLDQKVIAGVGNVYRAEALFLCGIHPNRPARTLTDAQVACLWQTIVAHMGEGARRGRIVTVEDAADDERLYVYRRGGLACRRCGAELRAWTLGGRTITACPDCQPA